MIVFQCPTCQTVYTVPDAAGGKKSTCRKCQQRLAIPSLPVPPTRRRTVLGWLMPQAAAKPSGSCTCPGCGRKIPVGPHELSQTFECLSCGTRFVPGQTAAGSTATAAPGGGGVREEAQRPVVTAEPSSSSGWFREQLPFILVAGLLVVGCLVMAARWLPAGGDGGRGRNSYLPRLQGNGK